MDFAKQYRTFVPLLIIVVWVFSVSNALGQTNPVKDSVESVLVETETVRDSPEPVAKRVVGDCQDELWFVSARNVECESNDLSLLVTETCDDSCWNSAEFSQLIKQHSADASKETIIYVHGNRTDEYWAKKRGLQVYNNLFGDNCSCRPPVRFVIWAWKSERSGRGVADFRVKSARANRLGAIFAETANAFKTNPPLIVGYSLGSQIIASAVSHHYLGTEHSFRLAVIVPAFDCSYSNCCNLPGAQTTAISKSVVFSNRKDTVIRAAKAICRFQSRNSSATFEEWAGMPGRPLGESQLIDISNCATHKHSIDRYTAMPVIKSNINQLLLENSTD